MTKVASSRDASLLVDGAGCWQGFQDPYGAPGNPGTASPFFYLFVLLQSLSCRKSSFAPR